MTSDERRLQQAANSEVQPAVDVAVGAATAKTQDVPKSVSSSSSATTVEVRGANDKMREEKNAPEDMRTRSETLVLMLALCMAVFLAALDMTIITTALPTISAHFHASEAGYTWIGSSYLLANAASVPSWGKISDIFGRKPILLAANLVFLAGSLICALSNSLTLLIVGRTIQGLGGGGLIVLVNICVSDLFSMRRRGAYFGLVGATWAIASAIGPIIGGAFAEKVSWRWCFYVNLPCDGAAFVILLIFLNIETPRTPIIAGLAAIDWIGSLTMVGGTVMFLLGLEFGGVSFPWSSATVICLIVFGLVVYGLFFLNEVYLAKYPVMPGRIFAHKSNCASLAVGLCHGFVFISGSYFLPLYFQAVLGATPILSGVYLLPFALSLSIVSGATGVLIRKTGRYLELIYFGMFFMALGFGLLIDIPDWADWPRVIIFQIIAGIGVGPNFQSPLIALQTRIAPRDIATATATFQFVRQLATSLSVVIGGVIFQNRMASHRSDFVAAGISSEYVDLLAGGSASSSTKIIKQLSASQQEVVKRAYTNSISRMWILYVVVAAIGLLIATMIGRRELSKEHQVVKTGLEAQREAREQDERKKRPIDEETGAEKS